MNKLICKNCKKEFICSDKKGAYKRTKFCTHKCATRLWQKEHRNDINARARKRLIDNPGPERERRKLEARKWRLKNPEIARSFNRKRTGTGEFSDEVHYYNYKEPLIKFTEGWGYRGTLAYNKTKDKVQCHLCGRFFRFINNGHLNKVHNITARDYKEKVGLSQLTALVGEGTRQKLVDRYLDMPDTYWQAKKEGLKKALTKKGGHPKMSLEVRNKRGTCPDQLLEKIKDCQVVLGKVPTGDEFKEYYNGRFMMSIRDIFGTYEEAVRKAGLIPNRELMAEKYSPKRLIEYLKLFFDQHNRVPVYSDFKRGLLPSYNVYLNRFGNLNEARRQAGLPILIPMGYRKAKQVRV